MRKSLTEKDAILADTIAAGLPSRLRSRAAMMAAKESAGRVLRPMMPDGTLQWLAFPRRDESARAYAARAVATANDRAAWAGGLMGS